MNIEENIKTCLDKLYSYCKNQNWMGYDPYDGLNSYLFRYTPFYRMKFFRQIWTQINKRSPINFRKIFLIKKGFNPKGLSLFVSGLVKIHKKTGNLEYLRQAKKILEILQSSSIKNYSGYCWGYNFPWQSRSFFAPINTPNAICTAFAANAFVDAYEITKNRTYLDIAKSSVDFFLKDLNMTEDGNKICFSYTPIDRTQVHNINLLVVQFIARMYSYTKNPYFSEISKKAMRFSVDYQNTDGSWYYGTAKNQKWIDGFHTGYVLVALKKYIEFTNDKEPFTVMRKGYEFFDRNFFLPDGTMKYYADGVYPIDIHSAAQGIVTYMEMTDIDSNAAHKVKKIFDRTLKDMWDKKRSYFYFQRNRYYTIKIPYIRWTQAWMFYTINLFQEKLK